MDEARTKLFFRLCVPTDQTWGDAVAQNHIIGRNAT